MGDSAEGRSNEAAVHKKQRKMWKQSLVNKSDQSCCSHYENSEKGCVRVHRGVCTACEYEWAK